MAETTIGTSRETREALRQAQRELSAAERRQLSTDDVIQALIRFWRSIAAAGQVTQ
jgi:hypothetical protein